MRSGPSRTNSAMLQTRRVSRSRFPAVGGPDVVPGPVGLGQDHAGAADERRSRGGHGHALRGPLEQGDAELALERLDLLRQRGCGDVQPFGRPREPALLRHGEEVPELAQFHEGG
jgi:hypothetical protein